MSMVFLFALLFTLSSHAGLVLETIEVSADKKVSTYSFSKTESISSEEIESSPQPLVSQILERVNGLVGTQNGGPGSRSTFFIRGTESRHVSYTLDGLKLNDTSNIDRQFDSAFLTTTSIDQILVHKGPQAVLYGSDAMGGHVEMITRKGSKNPEKKLTLSGGSFGTAGLSYRHDWEDGTLSVNHQRSDGISRFNKKRFDATERDGSEILQLTSSSKHKLSPKLKTDILASFIEGKNELDLMSDDAKDKGRGHQYLLQQKTRYHLNANEALSLRNGLNRNDRVVTSRANPELSFKGDFFQNELLWEKQAEKTNLIAEISHEKEKMDIEGNKNFSLSSAFLQGSHRIDRYTFQGGFRFDNHSRYKNFFTGSIGAGMETSSGNYSVQYSQGFKAPTIYQLYAPSFTGYPIVGNRDLKPESNRSYEARWSKKFSNLESEVFLFSNHLSNLIILTNTGYRNQGRFISEGVEPSLKWSQYSFEAKASFTSMRFRETEERVLRRPYNMGQLRGSYFPSERSEFYIVGRWFDSRWDQDFNGNKVKLNSFETFDLGFSHRWSNKEVSLQLVNLLDRMYEEAYGFSVLPRSLFGSFSVKI